jgi:trigger factor
MQVSVQSTGALERRMEVQVPAARIEKAVDERLRDVGRTARLKGFRPGKAPLNVVRRQFGSQIHREVVSEMLQASFSEAVAQQKLSPAGGPRIEPISMGEGQDLKYAAIFEILPEIALKGLDSLKLDRPVAEVTEADIDAMIESLRKQRPNWKAVTRAARKGDRVTVDFAGTIEGQPFDGGKAEGARIVLGEGRMLPEFENGLLDRESGAEISVDVRFPDDYHAKAVAGKTAVFKINVKAVEEQEIPELDDAFCAAFGVQEGGIAKLREDVTDNMRRELAENVRARLKSQVLDQLLAANPVELPGSMVEGQIRELQIDAARRMGIRDAAKIPPREPFVETAKRRVALGLLVSEIIRSEKIQLDRARVNTRLEETASSYDNPQEVMRNFRENHDMMHHIEGLVLEDQVVDWLLARAKLTERPTTFKELMNFGSS